MKQHSYCALRPTLGAMCELKRKPAQKLQKEQQSKRSLFDNGEMAVTLPPQPRFLPSNGFGGVTAPLAALPLGSTFRKDQLPPFWRFPKQWLPLLTKGQQGCFGQGPVRSIRRSLSSLAYQLLRKDPLTASLSVNSTTRCRRSSSCQLLMAPRTAIISSSWMIACCPLDVMASITFFSTSVLKKDSCSPGMLVTTPPRPL